MKTFVCLLTLLGHVSCEFWLQILHTNDIHSRFDEIDEHSGSCSAERAARKKCYGGFARLKTAVDSVAKAAKECGIPTLHVNCGDNFSGTPFYNLFGWKIVAEIIDKLGIDVMTLGNHEFDEGVRNLTSYLKAIKTPVVCSNLNLSAEQGLVPVLPMSKVLTVEGRKIGIVGYLTPTTMQTSRTEGVQILPEVEHVRAEAQRLKAAGVDIIVALGHSEFFVDLKVAREVEEVSVVVGAHSHTFLYTPRDEHSQPSTESPTSLYPYNVTHESGKLVPVVQAYAYSKYLGQLRIKFNDDGQVLEATGNPILLDGSFEKDREIDEQISIWRKDVDKHYNAVQGYSRVSLLKSNFSSGEFESTFGNLLTDAVIDQAVEMARIKSLPSWTHASIAMWHQGAVRTAICYRKCIKGITLADIRTTLPFDDELVEVAVRGSTIRRMLEFAVTAYNHNLRDYHLRYFMHVSGLRVVFDFSQRPQKRVRSVEALCTECRIPKFEPLVDERVYFIIVLAYLMQYGHEGYGIREEYINMTRLGVTDSEVLIRYLKKNQIVYPKMDGRITAVGFTPKELFSYY